MKRKSLLLCSMLCIGFIFLFQFFQEPKVEGDQSVENFYEKVGSEKTINYLIIGDSIGRGSGASEPNKRWFQIWENKMKDTYDVDFKRHMVVQSGSTAFEGLNKLNATPHLGSIDLTFIVFGENDRKYMNEKQFAQFYEGLLRQVKKDYPDTEIYTLTESPLDNELFIQKITDISAHYLAKNIDLRPVFSESTYSAFELTTDLVHPNDRGYQLYAEAIFQETQNLMNQDTQIAVLAAPLHDDVNIALQQSSAYTHASHPYKGIYWYSEDAGETIKFSFSGTFLGMKVKSHPAGGMLDIYIDGQPVRTLSTWWPLEKERYLYISSGLEKGIHQVTLTVSKQKSIFNESGKAEIFLSTIITEGTN
ncbi:GDSL-type esterase/lipase family protein [Cytobacillus kochii]|uniref:SGNH/GDSL hydrolase family protein n=1 Tax=Cytobacillus kochii TaxID=859143 RepID=UPI002786B9B2|nr:SGNH/GDSL hydrolase family protein [Cytobacillus kochii]MDQ0184057.1 lysophospholipase L1-like esterase [Cytobacillus kochii]